MRTELEIDDNGPDNRADPLLRQIEFERRVRIDGGRLEPVWYVDVVVNVSATGPLVERLEQLTATA